MRKESTGLQRVFKKQDHYGIVQWQNDTTDVCCSVVFSDNSSIAVDGGLGRFILFVYLRPFLNIELTFYRVVHCDSSISFLTRQIQGTLLRTLN